MGLIVKQTRIMAIQSEIESLTRLSTMAIRKCFSKDPTEKELGARQCTMFKDSLLRLAARLKMLNLRAYAQSKKSIEELFKRLQAGSVISIQNKNEIAKEHTY